MTFIVATNVIASRPPERRPTGTPHARANFRSLNINNCFVVCILEYAPQVYIELPLGRSRRELHIWGMGYWLLTYSGAMI